MQQAIAIYTDRYFEAVNRQLRYGSLSPQMARFVQVLDRALAALPAVPGTVWRVLNLSAADLESLLAAYGAALNDGSIVRWDAFSSASRHAPAFDGNVIFNIQSVDGRDISSLSFKPSEDETLLPRGASFRVIDLETWDGKAYISLQEIAP